MLNINNIMDVDWMMNIVVGKFDSDNRKIVEYDLSDEFCSKYEYKKNN